jgi:hypothetical protein
LPHSRPDGWTTDAESTTLDDVDRTFPPPDVLATAVDESTLAGTAKSLLTAARRAGYTVRATRALGPRAPRQVQQDIERTSSLALTGTMAGWRFQAINTDRDGWDVVLHRPGWPPEMANVTRLRTLFAAQTPAVIR